MKFLNLFAVATLSVIAISCTLEKTDFEAEIGTVVTEYHDFKEAVAFTDGNYKIGIEALNGTFYKGYNEIRLKIINIHTNEPIHNSAVTFLPILTDNGDNKTSCPHSYDLVYEANGDYYSGYSVFTSESGVTGTWELYVGFTDNDRTHTFNQTISVWQQDNANLNMTSFTGNDGETYVIALIAPQKPRVAENELVAGIYKYNRPADLGGTFPDPSQFLFAQASKYTLLLDPRMPEPSMGNHSSPNNRDLEQQNDGLYYGVVNYTMTGNWTLNFILLDENGEILKGTEVPTDFTPGIEGTKSELYIDILF